MSVNKSMTLSPSRNTMKKCPSAYIIPPSQNTKHKSPSATINININININGQNDTPKQTPLYLLQRPPVYRRHKAS